VEAVDEFEAERNQKRNKEQKVGQIIRYPGAGRIDVGIDAVGNEQQGGSDHAHVDNARQWMKSLVEIRSPSQGRLDRTG
jgi:hypothetical protein